MGPYVALQAPSWDWEHAGGAIMRRTHLEPKKCEGIASPQKPGRQPWAAGRAQTASVPTALCGDHTARHADH